MYGNIAKAHSKDKKTRYYYYCKNTVTPTGHECSFRLNIEQTEINKFVAKIISAMVTIPGLWKRFKRKSERRLIQRIWKSRSPFCKGS